VRQNTKSSPRAAGAFSSDGVGFGMDRGATGPVASARRSRWWCELLPTRARLPLRSHPWRPARERHAVGRESGHALAPLPAASRLHGLPVATALSLMRPTNSSHGMAWALAMGIWQSGSPVCSSFSFGLRPMCTPRLRAVARPSLARFTIHRRPSWARALRNAMKPRRMGVVGSRWGLSGTLIMAPRGVYAAVAFDHEIH
jgi:hypothetical protein